MTELENKNDARLDETLQLLNRVQPPARLEQRVHARLAQEQAEGVRVPLLASFAAAWTWPRAAFATATFTAGVVTATLLYPVLHTPRVAPTAASVPAAATATPASVGAQPAAGKVADVHPAFTVNAPGGRAAALNAMGTVAQVRSRREHSDTQLAANRRDKKSAEAKLAKPAKPANVDAAPDPAVPTQQ
jgi:hypothetical protein